MLMWPALRTAKPRWKCWAAGWLAFQPAFPAQETSAHLCFGRHSQRVENTLQVRINGVLWDETSTLFGQSAGSTVYIVRIEDDGRTSLAFGDGKSGSRLPTGMENVVAGYRSGIGLAGEVSAGSLSLLQTRRWECGR